MSRSVLPAVVAVALPVALLGAQSSYASRYSGQAGPNLGSLHFDVRGSNVLTEYKIAGKSAAIGHGMFEGPSASAPAFQSGSPIQAQDDGSGLNAGMPGFAGLPGRRIGRMRVLADRLYRSGSDDNNVVSTGMNVFSESVEESNGGGFGPPSALADAVTFDNAAFYSNCAASATTDSCLDGSTDESSSGVGSIVPLLSSITPLAAASAGAPSVFAESTDPTGNPVVNPPATNEVNPPQIVVPLETTAAPEPATLFLVGTGFVGLVGMVRRRRDVVE